MKILGFAVGALVASIVATVSRDAAACGGCFIASGSRTIVSGHRMIVSVSPTQTTLWDQFVYEGDPADFAWVLPTKGLVEVGLSSDVLFQRLEAALTVTVNAPNVMCFPPGSGGPSGTCNSSGFAASAGPSGGGTTGGIEDPVEILAHEVVGPYETVQLSAQDPAALQTWLASHGYEIPPDVAPVIDAYVTEGFDFLALKLVPGQAVDAMRPVRVTAPGANVVFPLRMVAAGTGQLTPVTLFVVGEGRYEPQNFPWFTIDQQQLWWDWATESSNYKDLRAAEFLASDNHAWQVEVASGFGTFAFQAELESYAQAEPVASGYADEMGGGALDACQADLADLFGTLERSSVWATRLRAELSRNALADDLVLTASDDQSIVSGILQVPYEHQTGDPCAQFDCHEPPDGAGASGSGANTDDDDTAGNSQGCNKCGIGTSDATGATLAVAGFTIALAVARRRRRSGRPA